MMTRSLTELSPRRRARQGVALMMSLLTLFLLISIAVPYSFMTSHQEAAMMGYRDRREVRDGAWSAIALGTSHLRRYHRLRQFANWAEINEGANTNVPWTPLFDHLVDGLDERSVNVATILEKEYGADALGLSARDPQGAVWSARLEDEQGKININTAPPTLLGNIFGSAIVEEADNTGSGYDIKVFDGAENFPEAAGPEKGYFVISSVLISYERRSGSTFLSCVMVPDPIQGLGTRRGKEQPVFSTGREMRSTPENLKWVQEGALMIPVVAHLVAYWRMLGQADGSLLPFTHVDQIRQIADLPMLNPGSAPMVVAPECFEPSEWARARSGLTVHSRGPLNNGFGYLHLLRGTVFEADDEDPSDLQVAIMADNSPLNDAWIDGDDPRRFNGGVAPGRTLRLRFPTANNNTRGTNNGTGTIMGDTAYALSLSLGRGMLLVSPEMVPEQRDNGIVEIQEVTPININSASREVIVANLKGLSSGGVYVSAHDAELIADAVLYLRYRDVAEPDARLAHLDEYIAAASDISGRRQLRTGVLRNRNDLLLLVRLLTIGASNKADGIQDNLPGLIGLFLRSPLRTFACSHAPFIFHSYGAYTVRGHATLHAPSGIEIARAGMREVVQAGTDMGENYSDDRKLRWEWRDRDYLLENSKSPLGSVMRVGRSSYSLGTKTPRRIGNVELPLLLDSQMNPPPLGTFEGRSSGELIWNLGRDRNIGGNLFRPSFVTNSNHELEPDSTNNYGQIPLNIPNVPNPGGGGAAVAVGDLQGGSMEFWYKIPRQGFNNDEVYLFDMGLEETTNRLSLLWWAPGSPSTTGTSIAGAYYPAYALKKELPALTLRIADRTLQEAFSIVTLKPETGRWEPGEWVYLRAAWKGLDIGHLSLLADSMARIGSTAQPAALQDQVILSRESAPAVWVSQTSYLTGNLDPNSPTISIEPEKARGFPALGVVRIGHEAIEYTIRTNDGTLSGLTRGARGTIAPNTTIPTGTRVAMWGYESRIDQAPDAPFLPRGGGALVSASNGHGRFRFAVQQTDNDANYLYPDRLGQVASVGPAAQRVRVTAIDGNSGELPEYAVLFVRGPAWRRYSVEPQTGLLVPDYALPTQPSRLARVTVPRGQPPIIQISNIQESFYLIQRVSNDEFVFVRALDRDAQSGELSASTDPGWYFMAGPILPGNISPQVTANGWESSGSIAIICSLHANVEGRYLDPATMPGLVPGLSARVQVATDYVDDVTKRPFFDWITYNDLLLDSNYRLFAYTQLGRIRNEANRISTAFQTAQTVAGASMGMREWLGATVHRLPAGGSVNPVFAVSGQGLNPLSNRPAGMGDDVTLLWEVTDTASGALNVNFQKTRATIARAEMSGNRQYAALWTDRGGSALASLPFSYFNNITQVSAFGEITTGISTLTSKMLKFPEPELPKGIPLQMRMGGANYPRHTVDGMPPAGQVDELRHTSFPVGDFFLLQAITPNDHMLTMNRAPAGSSPNEVGLIKIDDEYLSYSGLRRLGQSVTLLNIVRGVLGTQSAFHGANASVFNMAGIPVFRTSGTIAATDRQLPLLGPIQATPYGFLRAERGGNARYDDMEIIGYNRSNNRNFVSGTFTPSGIGGLFRGAYGTFKQDWDADSVFVQLPVRHPDFMPKDMRDPGAQVFAGTEVMHFEGREALPNAHFGVLRWGMDADGEDYPDNNADAPYAAKLVFRFNPDVDWSEVPVVLEGAGKESRLSRNRLLNKRAMERAQVDAQTGLFAFEFDWEDSSNQDDGGVPFREYMLDLSAIAPDAMQAFEWRLYFSYPDNSYARGRYKEAPRFRGLSVELESETRVLSHEETR